MMRLLIDELVTLLYEQLPDLDQPEQPEPKTNQAKVQPKVQATIPATIKAINGPKGVKLTGFASPQEAHAWLGRWGLSGKVQVTTWSCSIWIGKYNRREDGSFFRLGAK